MIGIVVKSYTNVQNGDPHSFDIKSLENGQVYFCHLGDIKQNEYKLYDNKNTPTVYLKTDDIVEFKALDPTPRASSAYEINKKAANDPNIQAAIKKARGSGRS